MIKAINVRNVLAKHMLVDGFELIIDLDKSEGSWLIDKRNGDKYLDFFSMFASMAVGYNNPKLVQHQERLGKIAVQKPTNSDMYSEEMADFLNTFSRIGIPDYLPHAFFIEGGALAVENALKTAFDWKVRKNFANGETSEFGTVIIHFRGAFHGRSGYTLSLTNTHDTRKIKFFPKFDWPRIINPKVEHPLNDENLAKVERLEKEAVQQIKGFIKKERKDIAGLIIEPIQGEDGDNHFRKEFIKELRQLCNDNDILFIMDEIQTGIGLTGKFWAHEHYEVQPDIICFGKKAQVCGILAGRRIEEVQNNVFQESSRIASTWGGNLVDMVRFSHVLKIIEEDNLIDNARVQGDLLLSELNKLTQEFPHLVSNARGKGLMCAIDLPTVKKRDYFLKQIFSEKIMIVGCGERSIRFRPHLVVTANEIEYGLKKIRKVLENF